MCFGCSKEPSHLDGSFEYPQHMISKKKNKKNRNKKNQLHPLIWGPVIDTGFSTKYIKADRKKLTMAVNVKS